MSVNHSRIRVGQNLDSPEPFHPVPDGEPPPSPAEMFRLLGLGLGIIVYMVCVILLLAKVLVH